MILVVAEHKDGKLNRASWETVAAAQALSGGSMPITIAAAPLQTATLRRLT